MNLFGYVGNNPQNFTDPLGLEVVAIYHRTEGRLQIWDLDTLGNGKIGPDFEFNGFFSGRNKNEEVCKSNSSDSSCCKNNPDCNAVKDYGPIPYGAYAIDKNPNKNGQGWRKISYRLYRRSNGQENLSLPNSQYLHNSSEITDPITGNKVNRNGFYIHPGVASWGCVTLPNNQMDKYNELSGIFERTSPTSFINDERDRQKSAGYLFVFD